MGLGFSHFSGESAAVLSQVALTSKLRATKYLLTSFNSPHYCARQFKETAEWSEAAAAFALDEIFSHSSIAHFSQNPPNLACAQEKVQCRTEEPSDLEPWCFVAFWD